MSEGARLSTLTSAVPSLNSANGMRGFPSPRPVIGGRSVGKGIGGIYSAGSPAAKFKVYAPPANRAASSALLMDFSIGVSTDVSIN